MKFVWKKLLVFCLALCMYFVAWTKVENVYAAEIVTEKDIEVQKDNKSGEVIEQKNTKSEQASGTLTEMLSEQAVGSQTQAESKTGTTTKMKSRPDYQIMVNRAANCVTVYEKDEEGAFTIPVRAFVCSCGREGHETPLGTFQTSSYYKWRLMVDGTYGHYAVRFNRGIMFHSIPYYTPNEGNLEWDQFNLLGQPASLGCVRLACADAKWIYDNCKVGTKVVVYDDAENPGPLGKPEEIKIVAENPMHKWDPTDTSVKNPWNTLRPSLYLTNDIGDGILYLPLGATQEIIRTAVGMKDALGLPYGVNDYKIIFYGNFDLNTAGVYQVSVRGIGVHGVRVEQEMTVCVVG